MRGDSRAKPPNQKKHASRTEPATIWLSLLCSALGAKKCCQASNTPAGQTMATSRRLMLGAVVLAPTVSLVAQASLEVVNVRLKLAGTWTRAESGFTHAEVCVACS